MKRLILILVLLGFVALGFGALKVAIVAGDAIGDRGFTDMAYIGVQEAQKQFGIEYKVFECNVDPSKYFDSLRAGAMNYDLIFVDPGYFFDKELAEVSAMFPSKTFVYIDGTSDLPNVVSVPFKQNEGAFLAGCLAALLTDKTELSKINPEKTVGFVGGFDMPVIRDYQAGYEHGVRYVDPDVKVIARYAGDHYDPALGKETAYSVSKEGADVIFQAAGPTGLGILEAARDYDFFAIGVDTDQGYLQPGFIVSSMMKKVDVAVLDVIRMQIENKLEKGSVHVYGIANGGVGLAYNEFMMDTVPASVYLEIKAIQEKIANGEIVVDSYFD